MTTPSASSPDLPHHRKVRVDLKPRSDGAERAYSVHIGRGNLSRLAEWVKEENLQPPYIIIADKALYPSKLYDQVRDALMVPNRENTAYIVSQRLAQGEGDKSWEFAGKILEDLAGIHRYSTIIALGGGVIGDLAGFVAGVCRRGINFIQIPTTLLSMVDSSVGGKTGVNLSWGKNLAGVFHQPRLVVADLNTLSTLPEKEFFAGMAEVIKYGAIRDKLLFDQVAKGVKPGDTDLDEIVEKCVAIKARIVESDEFETKGERALLNFGHTLGHAIEQVVIERKITRKKDPESDLPLLDSYVHGEAISLGMRAAAWLSVWMTKLSESEAIQIEKALHMYDLPLTLAQHFPRSLIHSFLGNDKKVAVDGKNRWVLLDKLGHATPDHLVTLDDVNRAIDLLYTKPIWIND